jgi:aminopeptidase N
MRELLESQYQLVGFHQKDDDPLLTKFHRINILSTACSVGHEGCIQNARALYAEWMNKTDPNVDNPIPTNLRRTIYCNGIRHGGEKEWDFAWRRYLESNVATEKAIILLALSCTRETWILNRYLHWAIKPGSGIRKQDSRSVMSGVANNDVGNFLAFNFVREKWSTIRKYFGTGFSLGGVIKTIASKFNTPYDLEELQFFKKRYEHELASAARSLDQAIEGTQANIAWMKANFEDITKWLEQRTSDDLSSSQ